MTDVVRTQKARSVQSVSDWVNSTSGMSMHLDVPAFWLIQSRPGSADNYPSWVSEYFRECEEISDPNPHHTHNKPVFARCCPVNPAHGFEDSIIVKSRLELRNLWDKMIETDPNGEILLMQYVSSTSSSIITPYTLTVGKGHDGATNGDDPLTLAYDSTTSDGLLNDSWGDLASQSGVGNDGDWKPSDPDAKHPFLEIVCNRHRMFHMHDHAEAFGMGNNNLRRDNRNWIVQCRKGEHVQSGMKDFVPKDFEVKKVIYPTGKETLIEWRDRMAKVSQDSDGSGVAVYHHKGAITSHWGINCMEYNIPYFTTYEPSIGNKIRAKDFIQSSYEHIDSEVVDGIWLATVNNENDPVHGVHTPSTVTYPEAVDMMLFGLHNYRLQSPRVGSRLLGLAIGSAMRLLQAACLGELRHNKKTGLSRQQIFQASWTDYLYGQKKMIKAWRAFRDESWSSGYGGHAWAECASSQLEMHMISETYAKYHGTANYKSLVDAFNIAVNRAHNNGWVFNKFADRGVFDAAAESNVRFAAECTSVLNHYGKFISEGKAALSNTVLGTAFVSHRRNWKKQRPNKLNVQLAYDAKMNKHVLVDLDYLKNIGSDVATYLTSLHPGPPKFMVLLNLRTLSNKRVNTVHHVIHIQYGQYDSQKTDRPTQYGKIDVPINNSDAGNSLVEKIQLNLDSDDCEYVKSMAGTHTVYAVGHVYPYAHSGTYVLKCQDPNDTNTRFTIGTIDDPDFHRAYTKWKEEEQAYVAQEEEEKE